MSDDNGTSGAAVLVKGLSSLEYDDSRRERDPPHTGVNHAVVNPRAHIDISRRRYVNKITRVGAMIDFLSPSTVWLQ